MSLILCHLIGLATCYKFDVYRGRFTFCMCDDWTLAGAIQGFAIRQ